MEKKIFVNKFPSPTIFSHFLFFTEEGGQSVGQAQQGGGHSSMPVRVQGASRQCF